MLSRAQLVGDFEARSQLSQFETMGPDITSTTGRHLKAWKSGNDSNLKFLAKSEAQALEPFANSSTNAGQLVFTKLSKMKKLTEKEVPLLFGLIGTNWKEKLEKARELEFKTKEFEYVIFFLFSEKAEVARVAAPEAVAQMKTLLENDILKNSLFEKESPLSLAEKYPEFEKWGHEKLSQVHL